MPEADFLGKGIQFPIKTSGGIFAQSEGAELIEESIRLILSTSPGERLMRPKFGCGLRKMVFAANTAAARSRIAYEVEEALKRWEPRIKLELVEVVTNEKAQNRLNIEISYKVLSNNNRYNMVYPFHLERE